ncbi:MAG: hypothetical protein SOR95_06190 [Sutterella sp.]|nr:hypothetical protein [Sutterella sp.]
MALLMLAYPAMGEDMKAITTVTDNKGVQEAIPSDTTPSTVITAPNDTASTQWLWEAKPVRVVMPETNATKNTAREQATTVAPTLSPDQVSSNAPEALNPDTNRADSGREKTVFPSPNAEPITQPSTPSVTLTLWCDTHYPEGVMESLAREALRLSRIPHLHLTVVFAGLPGRLVNHQPDEVRQRANATLKPLQATGIGITIDPPTLRHWRRVWANVNGITEQGDRTNSASASVSGNPPDREDAQDATDCDATTSLNVGPLPRLPLLVVEVSGVGSNSPSHPSTAATATTATMATTATTTTTENVVLVEGATSLEVALGRLLNQIPQTASELAFFSGLEAVLGERVEGPSARTERGSGFSTASPTSPASLLALFSSLTFQSPRDWAHGESEALALTRQLGVPAGVLATLTDSQANRGEQEDGTTPSGVALRATLRALHRGDSLARETGSERLVRLRQRGALALESEWVGGNPDD